MTMPRPVRYKSMIAYDTYYVNSWEFCCVSFVSLLALVRVEKLLPLLPTPHSCYQNASESPATHDSFQLRTKQRMGKGSTTVSCLSFVLSQMPIPNSLESVIMQCD